MIDEYKIKKEYSELLEGEEEIQKELNKSGGLEKGYKKYYLINNDWVERFKNLIINNKFYEYQNLLKVSLIIREKEEKDFSYINSSFVLNFSYNFTLVTESFMDLLCKNFTYDKQKKLKDKLFRIIIGGKCMIIRDVYYERLFL